jgi:hypothetical protein
LRSIKITRIPAGCQDRGADRLLVKSEPLGQAAQTVGIRRRRPHLDGRALSVEQMEVETLAAAIQTGVQH